MKKRRTGNRRRQKSSACSTVTPGYLLRFTRTHVNIYEKKKKVEQTVDPDFMSFLVHIRPYTEGARTDEAQPPLVFV